MPKKKKKPSKLVIPPQRIERRIYLIRRKKVMLSPHLAELYEVEPRTLVRLSGAKQTGFHPTSCSS